MHCIFQHLIAKAVETTQKKYKPAIMCDALSASNVSGPLSAATMSGSMRSHCNPPWAVNQALRRAWDTIQILTNPLSHVVAAIQTNPNQSLWLTPAQRKMQAEASTPRG